MELIPNMIAIDGEMVKTGPTPGVLRYCGFANADEVRRVAAKFSEGTPYMSMKGVADWFKSHV